MHTVKFATKVVDRGHPDDRLVTDKSESFDSFQRAMEFIRSIRARLSSREILFGNPELEVA